MPMFRLINFKNFRGVDRTARPEPGTFYSVENMWRIDLEELSQIPGSILFSYEAEYGEPSPGANGGHGGGGGDGWPDGKPDDWDHPTNPDGAVVVLDDNPVGELATAAVHPIAGVLGGIKRGDVSSLEGTTIYKAIFQ